MRLTHWTRESKSTEETRLKLDSNLQTAAEIDPYFGMHCHLCTKHHGNNNQLAASDPEMTH